MNHLRTIVMMIGATASTLFVGGCTSFHTESFWGPAQKLSGLGATFGWKPSAIYDSDSIKTESPDIEARVKGLIEADLASKGYRVGVDKKPDFSVCFRLGRQVARGESWDEAILEIDITDPATGGMVWRGRIQGRLDYAASPDARRGRLEKAVRQLMKPLPKAGNR